MSSRGVHAASTGEKRPRTSTQVREAYYRRLDIHMNEAADSFRAVVQSCQIQDRVASARRDFESQVDSSNLCHAADDILRLISELKVAVIVQEVTDSKQESLELRGVYDSEVKATERVITSLSDTVFPILESLESHYYRSCTTWGFEPVKPAEHDKAPENSTAAAVATHVNMSDE